MLNNSTKWFSDANTEVEETEAGTKTEAAAVAENKVEAKAFVFVFIIQHFRSFNQRKNTTNFSKNNKKPEQRE